MEAKFRKNQSVVAKKVINKKIGMYMLLKSSTIVVASKAIDVKNSTIVVKSKAIDVKNSTIVVKSKAIGVKSSTIVVKSQP